MKFDYQNPTPFDHLEAARKINKHLQYQNNAGNVDAELLDQMLTAQERNLATIEQMLTAQIAEFHDLPVEAMHELNRMIEAEEDLLIDLPGPDGVDERDRYQFPTEKVTIGYGVKPKANVVHVQFGEPPHGGHKDG